LPDEIMHQEIQRSGLRKIRIGERLIPRIEKRDETDNQSKYKKAINASKNA
jgi:hypothetical protein